MKMTKKKIILVAALIVCALAIISLGTVAWFNASDSIVNEFKMTDSDDDGTPDFSVDVYETEIDEDDTADADGDGDMVTTQAGNVYDHIAPGDVLAKDPTIKNTGDYDQWIRVYVTFDEYTEISTAYADHGEVFDLRTWLNVNATDWIADDASTVVDGNTVTYVYYLADTLVKDETATLFTTVSIPTWFVQEDMQYTSDNFTVSVKAQAIQADNTKATAKESFEEYWIY